MKILPAFLILGMFPILCAQDVIEMPDRAESADGLLVVHGAHPTIRGSLLQEGDGLRGNLDKLVGEMPGDVVPIVIEFHEPREGKKSMIRRGLLELPEQDGAYRLQVDVLLGSGHSFDQKEVRRTLLEMILYERSIRGKKAKDFGEKVLVRPWLVDGMLEAIAWQDGVKDRDIYAYLSKSGGWLTVEKLIEREKVAVNDPLEQEVFRASSGALVMALLAQPKGKTSMTNYLSEVALYEGEPMTLLRKHFPSINQGKNGLEKWWMLKVADMATSTLAEALTPAETDKQLELILKCRVKNEEGLERELSLEDWAELMQVPLERRTDALRPVSAALSGLSYRSYPGYRSVIVGYLGVVKNLLEDKPGKVSEVLLNLRTYRDAELLRMERVTDLMDWYYLSTVNEESGAFEDYLKFKKSLDSGKSGRQDRVSRYVDSVQAVFEED